MNKLYLPVVLSLFLGISCSDDDAFRIKGVKEPVISLNGKWEICTSSYDEVIRASTGLLKWNEIDVPGEAMMQGIPVKHDQPFLYRTEILIPQDYSNKTVKVRFEGVYSHARVWVNNNFVRDHHGGFTAWECDITPFVKAGEKAVIHVEVTDRADEISFASGYAKHQIGGILRAVSLLALPSSYPENVVITTDLDKDFNDATLTVKGLTVIETENATVKIELFDDKNTRISLTTASSDVKGKEFEITNIVSSPKKWDAEHPDLYRLRISYFDDRNETWSRDYMIGFREIAVEGNWFLVNGKQVKLRGACRHDIHPLLGRLTTPEYDLKDVLLAKEANMNFIRTSHYPPSDKFLEYCDKYGLFVESETAVCFVGSHRTADYLPGSSENDPDFTGRYISQLKEMVDNNRNHPSVIIWSIGNENTFGTNFKLSYDWVKANDTTRPVIYSYPGQVPDSIKVYEVISMHYPGTDGNMEQYGMPIKSFGHDKMPVIFDEWAHVPCYNQETVKEDPNIRDFWGMSLDTMWQKVFEADGGLGGAIWCMIDETFMLPEDLPGYNEWWGKLDKNVIPANFTGHTVGYGEWGFIDTWRRKKPEFWSVKKAYSPIRILRTKDYEFNTQYPLEIPVYNRFDFSNLNEINLKVISDGETFDVPMPDVQPHSKGIIALDQQFLPENGKLRLEFTDNNGSIIDYFELSGRETNTPENNITGMAELKTESNEYLIKCENGLEFHIDRNTGLFTSFENQSGKNSFSGPYINFRVLGEQVNYSSFFISDICTDWKMSQVKAEQTGNNVTYTFNGEYTGKIKADFSVVISADGSITTEYNVAGLPGSFIRESGIRFLCDNMFDTLSWKRDPYWPGYPEDHLSAAEGIVPLFIPANNNYRQEPVKEWSFDKKSFFYNGTSDETENQIINTARSTKENILEYSLKIRSGGSITVHGKGDKSCRIVQSDDRIILMVNDITDYPDIAWGNYSARLTADKIMSGKTVLSLE